VNFCPSGGEQHCKNNTINIAILSGQGQRSQYSALLQAGPSRDWIPVGERFSAPVQSGPGTHPVFCTPGIGSFPGVKRPGCGVDHPPTSKAKVKERVEFYHYSPSGPLWPDLGENCHFKAVILRSWMSQNCEQIKYHDEYL